MATVKYSGPVASFHCPTEATIRSLKVHFSPKQLGEGTPSPDNVREIQGWNDCQCIIGKNNIFNYSTANLVIGHYRDDNGIEQTSTSSSYITNEYEIDTTQSLYIKTNDIARIRIYFLDNNKKWISRTVSNYSITTEWGYLKFTPSIFPQNTKYIQIQYSINYDLSKLIICQQGNQIDLDWSNDISTIYGGYVDLVTGELVQNYEMIIINSTQEWQMKLIQKHSATQLNLSTLTENTKKTDAYGMFNYVKYMIDTSQLIDWNGRITNTGLMTIFIPSDINTRDDMNNYIAQHPLQVCYELATPITYQLTPIQLQTFLGQNNVWSNADYVEVEYDLHETQSILARKQFIIANQPHVVTPAAAPLQNFVTDMAAPLKECKVHFLPKQDLNGYSKPWIGGAGKNLFNINATEQNPDDTTAANTTARNFTAGTYCVGTSWSNWLQPNQVLEHSVSNSVLSIKNNNVYGVGYALKIQSETNYAISATSSNGGINAAFYDANGNFISGLSTNILNTSFTTPVDATIVVLTFYNRTEGSDAAAATFSNIQFEKRSSITSYEPWENICPISGQTGVELYRTGKNIFPSEEDTDKHPLFIRQGTQLTASSQMADGRNDRIEFYTKNKMTRIDYWNLTQIYKNSLRHYRSFTMASSANPYPAEWFRFSFGGNEQQIEFGSIATDYEPYTGTTIPITFPSEAGTVYGGYIDLINGELVQTHYVITIDKESNITQERTSHGVKTEIYHLPYTGANKNAISTNGYGIRERSSASWNYPTASKLYLYPDDANVTSVIIGIPDINMTQAEWVDWLSMHGPIQVYYELAEPIHYPIDPQTLKSLRGTNNLWSTANGNIELSYWKH